MKISETSPASKITAPVAVKKPHPITEHGKTRQDDYFWLREKENPEVIALLNQENAYTEAILAPEKELQSRLFDELKARILEDDASVPYKLDQYYYYTRVAKGTQYGIHCRRPLHLPGEPEAALDGAAALPFDFTAETIPGEEIILDENALAKDLSYFSLGVCDVSPDHNWLAYSIDNDGSEKYSLRFKNLKTGEHAPEIIANTSHSLEWASDNKTVFYTLLDENQRTERLLKHTLGTDPAADQLIHKEEDAQLFVYCSKTRSREYIFLQIEGSVTSEFHFIRADQPHADFRVIEPRKRGVLYSVTHHGDRFFIVTNDIVQNFRLIETPVANPGHENWKEVRTGTRDVFIEDAEAFAHHLVLHEREGGLPQLRILDLRTGLDHRIQFPEPTYHLNSDANAEFDTRFFRFSYTSLVTPVTVLDYDMDSRQRTVRKQQRIPSGYDITQYRSERAWARGRDGTLIPISIVYRLSPEDVAAGSSNETERRLLRDGTRPLYLYGYGSYGMSMYAHFSSARLSLLDRGFVFAIAHIRGGSEMGRAWYEDGKFLKKKNTFHDFIDCAEFLIQEGFTAEKQIVISGGSAGGLLVGATLNLKPDLFKAAVAKVPFVDVLNTMMDKTLPLTTLEYEEWGNPEDKIYHDYIETYSPYDNVERKDYPHLLVTSGLNDPRVTYWEPAKWVAKLREMKTDHNLLLQHINMLAGHGGASGRYEYLKEIALEYAFILKVFDRA